MEIQPNQLNMHFTNMNKLSTQSKGFTLVELIIVVPIALLVVGVMVYSMILLVGDALKSQEGNASLYELHDGLDQIEQDVRVAKALIPTTGAITSPQGQGSDNNGIGGNAFVGNNNTALIIEAYATTGNPASESVRGLVYLTRPANPCPAAGNEPYTYYIIYYLRASTRELYRRTYLPTPPVALCSTTPTPWQLNSCHPSSTGTACKTYDRLVASNVSSMALQYYNGTSSAGTTASANTTSVLVTLTTSTTTAGETITNSGSVYVTRLN